MLRLGVVWLKEIIARQAQAWTRHLHDFKVFLDSDGSTRSVKLPLTKYCVDGASVEESWVLLMHCNGAPGTDEEKSEEEFEEEKEGAGDGGGSGVPGKEREESAKDGGGVGVVPLSPELILKRRGRRTVGGGGGEYY